MGAIVRFLAFIALPLLLGACSVLKKGYIDNNQQYVPKNPNFKLKDKGLHTNVDIIVLYRMVEMYTNGNLVYPLLNSNNELNNINNYIKFYENGRCLSFSIPVKNTLEMTNYLKEEDLNPNNHHYNKNYYSSDGEHVKIESFVPGDGQGYYVILNYIINNVDTLIFKDKNTKIVYKKEIIPINWNNKYKVDW